MLLFSSSCYLDVCSTWGFPCSDRVKFPWRVRLAYGRLAPSIQNPRVTYWLDRRRVRMRESLVTLSSPGENAVPAIIALCLSLSLSINYSGVKWASPMAHGSVWVQQRGRINYLTLEDLSIHGCRVTEWLRCTVCEQRFPGWEGRVRILRQSEG